MASSTASAKTSPPPQKKTHFQPQSSPSDAVLLDSEGGQTSIQPHVVAKIAGLAVREVNGVHALVPFSTGQAITSLARTVTGAQMRDLGVAVEVGTIEAAVDVRITTDYGVSIPEIASSVRSNVSARIREMTGLRVTEVNIEVVDLFFAEDELTPAPIRRVQ